MKIIVDAMGGDNSPEKMIQGCIDAILESEGFEVILVGDQQIISTHLKDKNFSNQRLIIHDAKEVITNDDIPTKAIKSKKNSSMVVGLNLLKEKKGQAFISAGNSGALMTGALLIVGRIKGVDRPAFAPIIPNKKGCAMLIDAGLNTACKPINYQQFGIIGSIYMKEIFKIDQPKVGLLNVGTEDGKGNSDIKLAFAALSQTNINFIGNIEGNDFPEGKVDVAVCDGFVGNIILKTIEGLGSFIFASLKETFTKNLISKMAALIIKRGINDFKKKLDPDEYGGVPILGVNGIVYKCHGSSKAKAIKNAILKANDFTKTNVLDQIKEQFSNMEVDESE